MSDLDTTTLHAIAESAQSAATRVSLGDREGARAALMRAERSLNALSAGRPSHARIVRLGCEAVARARAAVETLGGASVTRRTAGSLARAALRAARRAKA